jgi:hypothetical protein
MSAVPVTGATDGAHPSVQVAAIDLPALETAMLRFVPATMAFAGILVTTLPAFANPATAADPSCGGRHSAARPTGTGPVVAIGCAGC